MRVLMVSTSYPRDASDWRGIFIRHLVGAISQIDSVTLSLWAPPGELPRGVRSAAKPEESTWLGSLMAAGGIAHLIRSGGVRGIAAPLTMLRMLRSLYRRELDQDLYHVNWLQNALMLPRDGRPLLATVLGADMQLLKLPGMTQLLRRVFQKRKVAICPNAEWMVPELQRRFGDCAIVRCVPFGIEPRWYAIDRVITMPAKWLCVSRLTRDKIGALFDWGARAFAGRERELHLFGPMQENIRVPAWVKYHGPASADLLCSEWFSGARGLITLSQHAEGRPQVMLEAMASGLPIVASRIAAHEDLLRHRTTGWLCDSADELCKALDALEDESLNRTLGLNARTWAQSEIGTWNDCATRYLGLYEEIMRP